MIYYTISFLALIMVCSLVATIFFSKRENKRRWIYVGISGLGLMLLSISFGAMTLGSTIYRPITAYSQDVNGDVLLDIVYEGSLGKSALLQQEDGTYLSITEQFPGEGSTTDEEWEIIKLINGY